MYKYKGYITSGEKRGCHLRFVRDANVEAQKKDGEAKKDGEKDGEAEKKDGGKDDEPMKDGEKDGEVKKKALQCTLFI